MHKVARMKPQGHSIAVRTMGGADLNSAVPVQPCGVSHVSVTAARKPAKGALSLRRGTRHGGLATRALRGLYRPRRRCSGMQVEMVTQGEKQQGISCPCTWRGKASHCEARRCSASRGMARQSEALQSVSKHGKLTQGRSRASDTEARLFHGTAGVACEGHSSGVETVGGDSKCDAKGAGARPSRSRRRGRVSQLCTRLPRGGEGGHGCLHGKDVMQASSMLSCEAPLIVVGPGHYATEVMVSPELWPSSVRKVLEYVVCVAGRLRTAVAG